MSETSNGQAGRGFGAAHGSARRAALKATCTMGILDRAILCGLGLSADSANIVMLHIEELRDQIKRMSNQMRPMTDEERRDANEFLKQHTSPNDKSSHGAGRKE